MKVTPKQVAVKQLRKWTTNDEYTFDFVCRISFDTTNGVQESKKRVVAWFLPPAWTVSGRINYNICILIYYI